MNQDQFFKLFGGAGAQGSEAYGAQQKADADLRNMLAGKKVEQSFEQPFKQGAMDVAKQQANTMEQYRQDQARRLEEESRLGKLKLLMGGAGADGKPLSNEAQKTFNLADTARNSLNSTEAFTKEHPIATAMSGLPGAGFVSKIVGGPMKEAYDTRAGAKEALQNLYTGAAASGEQVPAFQSFAGPSFLDALRGKGDASPSTRDAINTFQNGMQKQAKPISTDMLQAAGMQNDPIAQQALKQQEQASQARQQGILGKMQPQEQQLYQEIKTNPTHPNAAKAKLDLERKYGRIF